MTFYKRLSQLTQFSVTQHKSSNIKSHNNTTFLFGDEVAISIRLGIFWFIYCWLFHAFWSSLSLCGFPKHVLVLSDRAMIKQPRIVAQGPVTRKMNMQCELTKYCLLGLYHVDIIHKWERAGCGLVCFIFFFFCCLFVLFLRKYIDRIAE